MNSSQTLPMNYDNDEFDALKSTNRSITTIQCDQLWTIERFSSIQPSPMNNNNPGDDDGSIESEWFGAPHDQFVDEKQNPEDLFQFSIRLVPKHCEDDDCFVSMYLQLHLMEKSKLKFVKKAINYRLSIVDPFDSMKPLYYKEGEAKFDQLIKCWGHPRFIRRDQLLMFEDQYVFKDRLTIHCWVSYCNELSPIITTPQFDCKLSYEQPIVESVTSIASTPSSTGSLQSITFNDLHHRSSSSRQRSFDVIGKLFKRLSSNGKHFNHKSDTIHLPSFG
ncbi:hypothetical protein RDWZM_004798, partial [Blomia tropicalis]